MAQSTQTISPLRQRMIDDMRLRKLSPKTQTGYIRAVRQLAGFLGRSPDSATVEELRRYQLHLVDHGVSPVSLNATLTGLKFFFEVAAETVHTIAADPRHLVSRIGLTLVLHTWGSALTHHPHVHGIVPGGGLSPDGQRWVACRPGFFLPVRVLSRLFRRRFLDALAKAHAAGRLRFVGDNAGLVETAAFAEWLAPLRQYEWVVYAKRPFAGPAAVLPYLARYTHRVAIANSRLIALDERGVTFKWKDYRVKGKTKYKTMTLGAGQFVRRFLLHVLPTGFHRKKNPAGAGSRSVT